jgi:SAM-dependent methyltransferase
MSDGDRERWNARHAGRAEAQAASPFLDAIDDLLPRRGRALDVAGGSGRNALMLARRGLDVTLADVSDVALDQARAAAGAEGLRLATLQADLEAPPPGGPLPAGWPLPPGPWDLILCSCYLHRPLFAAFAAALAPGGLLVVAHATLRNLERHPRPGPDHLLREGELPGLAAGLEVVRFTEGWTESGRHEARLVARRPAGGAPLR